MRFPRRSLALLLAWRGLWPAARADCNATVLQQVAEMPQGGHYAATHVATIALERAAHFEAGKFFVLPSPDSPSYCSGATYLVFLKTIEELRRQGALELDPATLEALVIRGQRDGEGIWGRWNANGPGTARLFHELELGPNFADFASARPGDFMKIFWTAEVGSAEHGHSVVYLGTEMRAGVQYVLFWSSNIPGGLRGEERAAQQDRAGHFLAAADRRENLGRIKDAAGDWIPICQDWFEALQLRGGAGEVRDVTGEGSGVTITIRVRLRGIPMAV